MINLDRRKLLQAAAAQSTLLGFSAKALADVKPEISEKEIPKIFPSSICKGAQKDMEFELQVIEGSIPEDIHGHGFFMESIETPEFVNLAAAKGVINRLDFQGGKVNYKRKLIKTPSVLAYEHFEDSVYKFNKHGVAYISSLLGVVNFCNTNFVELGEGRIGISYDAGRPFEINPQTLELHSPIGGLNEWYGGLPSIAGFATKGWPFKLIRSCAHPYYDKNTNEFITVNFDTAFNTALGVFGSTFIDLMVWNTKSELNKFRLIDNNGKNIVIKEACHTLVASRNHVLIFDTPFALEIDQMIGLKVSRAPANVTPVHIVKRSDLKPGQQTVRARTIILEKEWQHIMVDFDDHDDVVTLIAASSPCVDFSENLKKGDKLLNGEKVRENLYGMISTAVDEGEFASIRIHVGKESAEILKNESRIAYKQDKNYMISLQTWRGNNSFPEKFTHTYWVSFGFNPELLTKAVYDNYKDYPFRKIPLGQLPGENIPPTLQRFNNITMEVDQYWDAPAGVALSSPQFFPKANSSGSQTSGYIVCTAVSDFSGENTSGDEFWVFDAENIDEGPICKLGSPDLNIAFTLHTMWVPSLNGISSDHPYKISGFDDFSEKIKIHPNAIKKFFENEVYPRF